MNMTIMMQRSVLTRLFSSLSCLALGALLFTGCVGRVANNDAEPVDSQRVSYRSFQFQDDLKGSSASPTKTDSSTIDAPYVPNATPLLAVLANGEVPQPVQVGAPNVAPRVAPVGQPNVQPTHQPTVGVGGTSPGVRPVSPIGVGTTSPGVGPVSPIGPVPITPGATSPGVRPVYPIGPAPISPGGTSPGVRPVYPIGPAPISPGGTSPGVRPVYPIGPAPISPGGTSPRIAPVVPIGSIPVYGAPGTTSPGIRPVMPIGPGTMPPGGTTSPGIRPVAPIRGRFGGTTSPGIRPVAPIHRSFGGSTSPGVAPSFGYAPGGLKTPVLPEIEFAPAFTREFLDDVKVADEAVGSEETGAPTKDAPAQNDNWLFWRGPNYDGQSNQTGLPSDFDIDEGVNVRWANKEISGRSTPVIMNGKIYALMRSKPETKEEGEKVVCLDADTGETIWENSFNVWLSDVPDTRVGWSSVVADEETGNVYALGVCGYFQCIEGDTGKTVWSVPMHERFGLLSTYGGRTNFPIICDDLVIISAVVIGWGDTAKPAHRFVAFDKKSGEVVWYNGTRPLPYDTTYSAPSLKVINGQKMLVIGSGDGSVWAIQPRTGQPIWNYEFSRRGLNVPPLVVGDRVFSSHSEENASAGGATMGGVVAIDGTKTGNISKTGELWNLEEYMAGKAAPLFINNRLYVFDDRAKLWILDAETGEEAARRVALGTVMRSSPIYADGKIYACTANGRWYILEPDEDKGVNTLSKGRFPSGEEVHASPIVSRNRVYIMTTGALYCLEDKDAEHGQTELPAAPEETAVDEDTTPAHVQLIPLMHCSLPILPSSTKCVSLTAKASYYPHPLR